MNATLKPCFMELATIRVVIWVSLGALTNSQGSVQAWHPTVNASRQGFYRGFYRAWQKEQRSV